MSKPARCRQQGLAAWALYRLCAASGRRTVTGAPGEGTSDTGDCQSGPRSEHTGSEIAVSRVCVQWSVFMEYSLFMINQCCCTQSHELERRRSIQIMNLLKAVNSNQLSVFMTRPGVGAYRVVHKFDQNRDKSTRLYRTYR